MAHFMLGIRTDNWVILAADTTHFLSGAIKISESHQKEYKLGTLTSMVCFGEAGDVDSFANWAKANCELYSRRNGQFLPNNLIINGGGPIHNGAQLELFLVPLPVAGHIN